MYFDFGVHCPFNSLFSAFDQGTGSDLELVLMDGLNAQNTFLYFVPSMIACDIYSETTCSYRLTFLKLCLSYFLPNIDSCSLNLLTFHLLCGR